MGGIREYGVKAVSGTISGATKSEPYRGIELLCFAVLGGLTSRGVGGAFVLGIVGLILGFLGMMIIGWVLGALNTQMRQEQGGQLIKKAVGSGFLVMVPFTVLALLAKLVLGWDVALVFASAGIMASGAAAGSEVGGGRMLNSILASVCASGFSAIWMMLGMLAQGIGGV